jgi:hypothetical protein
MKTIVKSITFSLCFMLASFSMTAQSGSTSLNDDGQLPKVFLIGQHEEAFEALTMSYESDLLMACESDMNTAFKKWMSMMEEMEAYSKQIEYDLDGVKAWFHFFWANDGSIEHIAYYLRPNSKNLDLDEMNAFLASFMNNYKFPLVSNVKYHHYTGAAFPVFYQSTAKAGN